MYQQEAEKAEWTMVGHTIDQFASCLGTTSEKSINTTRRGYYLRRSLLGYLLGRAAPGAV